MNNSFDIKQASQFVQSFQETSKEVIDDVVSLKGKLDGHLNDGVVVNSLDYDDEDRVEKITNDLSNLDKMIENNLVPEKQGKKLSAAVDNLVENMTILNGANDKYNDFDSFVSEPSKLDDHVSSVDISNYFDEKNELLKDVKGSSDFIVDTVKPNLEASMIEFKNSFKEPVVDNSLEL